MIEGAPSQHEVKVTTKDGSVFTFNVKGKTLEEARANLKPLLEEIVEQL